MPNPRGRLNGICPSVSTGFERCIQLYGRPSPEQTVEALKALARRRRGEAEQCVTSSPVIIGSGQPAPSGVTTRSRHPTQLRDARLLVALERLLTLQVTDLSAACAEARHVVLEVLEADNVDVLFDEPGPAAQVGDGVPSRLAVPLEVADERRGVLAVSSMNPDAFDEQDLHFLEAVAHWLRLTRAAVQDGQDGVADGRDLGGLTVRQLQIAALIRRGLTNAEIAEHLVLGTGTVANHVANILGRLGLRSRAQIAAWAAERDLDEAHLYVVRAVRSG